MTWTSLATVSTGDKGKSTWANGVVGNLNILHSGMFSTMSTSAAAHSLEVTYQNTTNHFIVEAITVQDPGVPGGKVGLVAYCNSTATPSTTTIASARVYDSAAIMFAAANMTIIIPPAFYYMFHVTSSDYGATLQRWTEWR